MVSRHPSTFRSATGAPREFRPEPLRLKLLFALVVALIIAMDLLGGKIAALFGVPVSVSIFVVPVTFLITDVVTEVFGRAVAQQFILCGVVTLAAVLGFTALAVALPGHPRYADGREYEIIFGGSLRIMIASSRVSHAE